VVPLDLYEWNSRQNLVQNALMRYEMEGK
jgi:hypothetical protein